METWKFVLAIVAVGAPIFGAISALIYRVGKFQQSCLTKTEHETICEKRDLRMEVKLDAVTALLTQYDVDSRKARHDIINKLSVIDVKLAVVEARQQRL